MDVGVNISSSRKSRYWWFRSLLKPQGTISKDNFPQYNFDSYYIRYLGSSQERELYDEDEGEILSVFIKKEDPIDSDSALKEIKKILNILVASISLNNLRKIRYLENSLIGRPISKSEYMKYKDKGHNHKIPRTKTFKSEPNESKLIETSQIKIDVVSESSGPDYKVLKSYLGLLDSNIGDKHKKKIQTAFNLICDGQNSEIIEQEFLTLYTALNYLIEDVGRQNRSAKSESVMCLKLAQKGIIDINEGLNWIEELNNIHNTRSEILWEAKDIENQRLKEIKEFFLKFLPKYLEYLKSSD